MRLPKLDNRLRAIYEMLIGADTVCDIGADHGKLALMLAKSGFSVTATDISEPSLKKAKRLARLHGANIDFRLGDGLKVVSPGEANVAVMAGMGQGTIAAMLRDSREVVDACDYIVMQSMNGEYDLRSFLSDELFEIAQERVVLEGKRLYCIIKAIPHGGRVLSEAEKYLGPCLLNDRNEPETGEYIKRNVGILEKIVRGMESVNETQSERYLKTKKALDEIKGII